jgi:hypothetical protein
MQVTDNKEDTFTRSAAQRWAAPEAAKDLTPTTYMDVWAFGMTMIEVFSLQEPFCQLRTENEVIEAIAKKRLPNRPQVYWVTDELWALIQDCWNYVPQERPTMDQVYDRLLEAEKYRKEHPPTLEQQVPQVLYSRSAHLDPMRR